MKKSKIDKKKILLEFDDILDFTGYAKEGPEDGWSRAVLRNSFCGGSWEDAVTQALTGNPWLVKSFFDGVNVLNAMIEEEELGEIRDVTGEYFDVADYLAGEPEVFRRDEWGYKKQVVPVYANFGMNGGIQKYVIRNRGCGIVALCDELVRSGFIVDLRLVEGAEDHGMSFKGYDIYTNIKVRLDPLDLDTAAFIIANPLCLRRLWFAVVEKTTNQKHCGNYGQPCEYDLSDIFESGLSGFYFTSSNHSSFNEWNYRNLNATKDHILKMIEEFKQSPEQVILG